jgi:hypothetical protein
VIDVAVDRDLTMGPAGRPARHLLYQGKDTFTDAGRTGIEVRFNVENGQTATIERRAPGEPDVVLRRQ